MNGKSSIVKPNGWRFRIDRGGTFTDLVAISPEGGIFTHKLLSSNPEQYDDAAVQGMKDVLGLERNTSIPPGLIESVRLGTTEATNALLERKVARTALVTTRGFGDALRIGDQARPRLFDRCIKLPELLYERVIEADERVSAEGDVLKPLDEKTLLKALESAYREGIQAVAVVFLHGYLYWEHEEKAAAIAEKVGFKSVSVSHEVVPLMKLLTRGETTVADACLTPVLEDYVTELEAALAGTPLFFVQSNGGLAASDAFRAKDSIMSGPAGGVVGMSRAGMEAGFDKVIGFDMGGTSTDVSRFSGSLERMNETYVGGVRIRVPMLRIQTVAAGGGSVLEFDGGRFRVGPGSAGADPGPVCYRRGGPLTVTDANVMLGKIQPDFFPAIFGQDGRQPLDLEAVHERFKALVSEVARAGSEKTVEEIAEGFLLIAVENMANAIRSISVRRGYDLAEYALCCFGGAGGQHACLVADTLGMKTVLIHPHAGVLSAWGAGEAELRRIGEKAVELPLDDGLVPLLEKTALELVEEGRSSLAAQWVPDIRIVSTCEVSIRYEGTDSSLPVPFERDLSISKAFEKAHLRRFGFTMPGRRFIVEAVRAEVSGAFLTGENQARTGPVKNRTGGPSPVVVRSVFTGGRRRSAPFYSRRALQAGDRLPGPAVLIEENSTTVVEPEWTARVDHRDHLIITRDSSRSHVPRQEITAWKRRSPDPVFLEVFYNKLGNIAEQMGEILAKTAHSVNIKERLDFSCAVFDRSGRLVANSPHIPVHLGSMSDSVRAVMNRYGDTAVFGDVFVLNAPYDGGTHLPDVTVVTPLVDEKSGEILSFTASRGHHAEIGGVTPGSMPPDSTTIHEEGVLIEPFKLVAGGSFLEEEMRRKLLSGVYPSRNPDQNIADLRAQIAANEKGILELKNLFSTYDVRLVNDYMGFLLEYSAGKVRKILEKIRDGEFTYLMDDGVSIRASVRIDRKTNRATVDFSGTSPGVRTNWNAPPSVTRAAVLYVFRTLVDEDIPLNDGFLEPVDIFIPEGSILDPTFPVAVAAGNVETSQCVADTLFGALGILSASQGTMNNLSFGDGKHQYYETICGGAGAGSGFDGADAVHTHMTNSRLTDPEVLERRFPVRIEEFSIRHGSGGVGKWRGGNGVRRRLQFLEPMKMAVVSGHRLVPPFGLAGGGSGATGRNTVIRASGEEMDLGGTAAVEMSSGDRIIIETPGGGGYGEPEAATGNSNVGQHSGTSCADQ